MWCPPLHNNRCRHQPQLWYTINIHSAPFYFDTQLRIYGYLCVLRSCYGFLISFIWWEKNVFSSPSSSASHPTKRSEHFLTVVVVLVVVAKSSTWILHQHKGNALSILQSLYVTRKCACGVCACVCLQVNVFFAALVSLVSYRFVSFSPIFPLCSVYLPFE